MNEDEGAAESATTSAETQSETDVQQQVPDGAAHVASPDLWGEIDEDLKGFIGEKTPAQVAQELRALNTPPGEGASDEEIAAYQRLRGIPEKPDGYELVRIRDELKIGEADWDKAEADRFATWAKSAGLSKQEAQNFALTVIKERLEQSKSAQEAQKKIAQETESAIKSGWGGDFEKNTQSAQAFARHLGIDDDVLGIIARVSGNKPEAAYKVMDFMRRGGEMLAEGGQPNQFASSAVKPENMSPEQARKAIDTLLSERDNRAAYLSRGHKNHKEIYDRMQPLLKAANNRNAG